MYRFVHDSVAVMLGALRHEDGKANNDGSKNYISGSLFTLLCRSSWFYFFVLNSVKND